MIDLYQIHWPNLDEDIKEAIETMAEFQDEGVIRYLGVSNFSVEQMKRATKITEISSNQLPYSLAFRGVEDEILPYCLEYNIGIINYSPMASGLLSGKMTHERLTALPDDDWRKHSDNFKRTALYPDFRLGRFT